MRAEQLQILQVVCPAARTGDDVIHLEQLEGEFHLAAAATPFLLAEEDVAVLAVGAGLADVGAPGDVVAGGHQAAVEEITHEIPQADVDQLGRFDREVDAEPLAAELLGGDAGRGATAEGIQHEIAFVRRGCDDALQQGERFLRGVAGALKKSHKQNSQTDAMPDESEVFGYNPNGLICR